jgi:hypothetical protein
MLYNGEMRRKNPRYYEEESRIDSYLGINRRSEND